MEQTHKMLLGGGGGGGGGGGRHCTLVHIPVYMYMNRVLPKCYKEVSSYDCTFRKGLLHGMSYTPECMHEVTYSTGRMNTFFVA